MGKVYSTISFVIDEDLYNEAGEILLSLGMTHEEAVQLFLKEMVRIGRIPFDYTEEDLLEAKRLSSEVEADRE